MAVPIPSKNRCYVCIFPAAVTGCLFPAEGPPPHISLHQKCASQQWTPRNCRSTWSPAGVEEVVTVPQEDAAGEPRLTALLASDWSFTPKAEQWDSLTQVHPSIREGDHGTHSGTYRVVQTTVGSFALVCGCHVTCPISAHHMLWSTVLCVRLSELYVLFLEAACVQHP